MTISHLPELVADRRRIAPPGSERAPREETAARRLLEAHDAPLPEARFGSDQLPDAARGRDALATCVMDLYRQTRDSQVFDALAGLVRRPLVDRVRVRLRTLGLSLDPEEVLQDALVNVFRYPDHFDSSRPGAFRAWSSTIVDNVIRRHLRRSRTGLDLQLRTDEQLSQERDVRSCEPSLRAEQGEECETTCRALTVLLGCYLEAYHALSERERFVLQMVEVRGMRYAELAKVLEIRPEALKMVVFRARRRIHERLTVMFSRASTSQR